MKRSHAKCDELMGKTVTAALGANRSLRMLTLTGNKKIDLDTAQALGTAVGRHPHLIKAHIRLNIEDNAVLEFVKGALKSCSLLELNLRGNDWSVKNESEIVDLLDSNESVISLILPTHHTNSEIREQLEPILTRNRQIGRVWDKPEF